MTAVPPSPGLLIPAPRHEETRLLLLLQQLHFFLMQNCFVNQEWRQAASGKKGRGGGFASFLCVVCELCGLCFL